MKKFLEKQGWHAAALIVLLAAAFLFIMRQDFRSGQLWGISSPVWYWAAILIPILHQVFVLLVWRAELYSDQWVSKTFGSRGFQLYGIIFFILFFGRPVSILLLGIANTGSLTLAWPWRIGLGILFFIPAAYLGYSVMHYFGIARALGADHFDESYRKLPMVKEGFFKYSSNSMYVFGFLLLWSLAFLTASKAALFAAAFNHLYIWIHYYTTEEPDMQYIYGEKN
ncbi:MAG TPA: methyltransferase [Anaerolineales bacterium]|nr:methyltransferase [Anaerolineales bacterium]